MSFVLTGVEVFSTRVRISPPDSFFAAKTPTDVILSAKKIRQLFVCENFSLFVFCVVFPGKIPIQCLKIYEKQEMFLTIKDTNNFLILIMFIFNVILGFSRTTTGHSHGF